MGEQICSNGPGHMIIMAIMIIYGKKHFKTFFSGTCEQIVLKLSMT